MRFVITGKRYRITHPDKVVAYTVGVGLRKLDENDRVTVLAWPTQGPLPRWASGGKHQWCDVTLATGEQCAVWNLSYLEPVGDGEPIDSP